MTESSLIRYRRVTSTEGRIARVPVVPTMESSSMVSSDLEPVFSIVVETIDLDAGTWTWPSRMRWVAAKHSYTRSELRTAQRDHVFPSLPLLEMHAVV